MVQEDPELLLDRLATLPAAGPLLARLEREPTEVFLIGGAVRDLMLGREPRELDLAVESELGPVIEQLGAAATVHDRFGTATLTLGGFQYDLARTRRETYEQPGALPTVSPARLDEDLERRDFTVNAVALAIAGPRRGLLVALPSAFADLRAHELRVLHDASFTDDPTRLMRLALYASRLQFAIEPHTLELAHEALDSGALQTVSGERAGAELRRLAYEPDPVAAFEALGELGIDEALAPGFGLRIRSWRGARSAAATEGDRATLTIATAGLDLPGRALPELLARLAFEAPQRDAISAAAARARQLADALEQAQRPSQIAAAVGKAGLEAVALAGALGADRRGPQLRLKRLRFVALEIDGNDLLAAGVPSGPAIGAGLRAALAAKSTTAPAAGTRSSPRRSRPPARADSLRR